MRHGFVPRRATAILVICACLVWIPGCDRDWWFNRTNGYCWIIAVCEFLRLVTGQISQTISKDAVTSDVLDTAYLGAAAHLTGAADTNWRSDIELHNASDDAATVTIELLSHDADNSQPASTELYLGPRNAVRIADVLAASFGDVDKGALRISTSGGSVMATDRTYNLLEAGNALGMPAGATFGQFIPLLDDSAAISHGGEGRLIGLTHDSRARTNLGLVNVSSIKIWVKTELYLADGTALDSFNTRLEPYEYQQVNRVFERATSDPVADGYLVVTTTTEGGAFLAQASVADAITSDPVFVPAGQIRMLAGQNPPALWIVGSAHATGAAGTNWRTDLEVHNPNDEAVSYTVELLEHGTNNSSPQTATRTLSAGESARHEDALIDLFAFEGAAALRIVPDGGPLMATSRTYNLLEAGNEYGLPGGATFGQFIPAVDASAAITADAEGRMVHLAHSESLTEGSRSNLALVNGTGKRAPVTVELFEADSTPLGSFDVNLNPYEYRQVNNVFRRVTSDSVADGYAVVTVGSDDGEVFALASVADNLTGDPVGMMATIVRSRAADGVVGITSDLMDLFGGAGNDDPATLEEFVAVIQDQGVSELLDALVDAQPEGTASSDGSSATADYGDGTTVDGTELAGMVTLDTSDLTISADGIHGQVVELHDGFTVNGEAAGFDELVVDLDLEVRGNGTVAGSVGLTGQSTAKSAGGTLEGLLEIDTAICLYYPIGGEVVFTPPGGGAVTIRFGPDCDGSFDTQVEPAWDWQYRFQNPQNPWAHSYISSVVNAHINSDVAQYWSPDVGGTEFGGRGNPGDTPAGIITYRFPFARPVEAAYITTDTATFHFSYSRGHNYLLASADGVEWVVLNEVPPPVNEGDPPRNGYFAGALPASVLGGTELWIRVELYCYGPYAPGGYTNTSQHARYWKEGARDTFTLEVRCAGGDCDGS